MPVMFKNAQDVRQAYEDGFVGWKYNPATMNELFADGVVDRFGDVAPHLRGIGAGRRALLWRSREKFDPGGYGAERQVRGSCVSHGSRNAYDTTRSVDIDIKGEPEEYFKRGATEPTYAARSGGGEGMDPAEATRFLTDTGFLFRQKYPFGDLSQLNETELVDEWHYNMPAALIAECKKTHVGRWVAPTSIDEVKDLFQAGYACHSGQNFGVSTESDERGISVPSSPWGHDMATVGYDDTKEVYPTGVFLVANSWADWNSRPQVWPEDVYGPWPEGSFWVAEDVYEEYFLGSGSIFFFCDIVGVPRKKLPDYGFSKEVWG